MKRTEFIKLLALIPFAPKALKGLIEQKVTAKSIADHYNVPVTELNKIDHYTISFYIDGELAWRDNLDYFDHEIEVSDSKTFD